MSPVKPQIVFRLSPELLVWVRCKAREKGLSITDFIVSVIKKEMAEAGDTVTDSGEGESLETVTMILDMDSKGISYTRIARELNRMGILTKRKAEWYAESVSRIVEKYGNRVS